VNVRNLIATIMFLPEQIKSIYKYLRIAIYFIPFAAIFFGGFFILFPIDTYNYFTTNPTISKFEPLKNELTNTSSFGIFPLRSFRDINLKLDLKEIENKNCGNFLGITLTKTYSAFLLPDGTPINSQDELKQILFENNKSKYPNGSLLHLKPTNEVFFVSHGKITLFPGPEIFQALGFSFDNLTDVDKATTDLFPVSDTRVFKWTDPHPDGTIFESYPTHRIYMISNGTKRLIESKGLLDGVWPQNYTIPVDDPANLKSQTCKVSSQELASGQIKCAFDNNALGSLGKYLNFTLTPAEGCKINSIDVKQAEIKLVSTKTVETAKQSMQGIAASVLNRYFYKVY
jgi:hypothetical protein